jgi:hypothetical protein
MILRNRRSPEPSKAWNAATWNVGTWNDGTKTVISCHELIEFCLDYLDGELPQDEEVGFRRHLAQCTDCVSFFETYRKTPELSREALKEQIPLSVKESVRSFLMSRR